MWLHEYRKPYVLSIDLFRPYMSIKAHGVFLLNPVWSWYLCVFFTRSPVEIEQRSTEASLSIVDVSFCFSLSCFISENCAFSGFHTIPPCARISTHFTIKTMSVREMYVFKYPNRPAPTIVCVSGIVLHRKRQYFPLYS